jgi:anthranilate synthase component 2
MIVLVDNYDSFTFNLFHYLGGLGAQTVVHRNDRISVDEVMRSFGGKIVRTTPMHGKLSEIRHNGRGVFRGINGPLKATRYHSLVVERASMPKSLGINAETEGRLVMGLAHDSLPAHGVQFHPESIASEHGHLMLKNFLDIARAWNAKTGRQPARPMHAAE